MLVLRGHEAPVRCLAYAPGGGWLASGGADQTVRVWDVQSSDAPTVMPAASGVEAAAWSPDGSVLAIGLADGSIRLRTARSDWRDSSAAHPGGVTLLAFSQDGQTLVSAGWDRQVRQTLGAGQRQSFPEPVGGRVAAFDPAAERLAVQSPYRDAVVVRGLGASTPRTVPAVPEAAMAFSPGGELLALGRPGGAVEVYAVESERLAGRLVGHEWIVYGLSFSPDSRSLVSGGADGTVRLWDVSNGRERAVYRWHRSWVTAIAFAPDGLTVAAASADHSIVIWDAE